MPNVSDLDWTEPLGFNNTFAILVRGDDARKLQFENRQRRGEGVRPNGAPVSARISCRAPTVIRDLPELMDFTFRKSARWICRLTYRALAEKQVDLIAGNSTDGLIARYGLLQLEDDRQYFPPYDAVPVVRQATLAKYPELREVLKQLGGILTVDEMRKLNYAVDGEKRQPKDVARRVFAAQRPSSMRSLGIAKGRYLKMTVLFLRQDTKTTKTRSWVNS